LRARFVEQAGFFRAIEAQHRAQEAGSAGEVGAECDVLQHAAGGQQLLRAERAGDAECCDATWRQVDRLGVPKQAQVSALGGMTPLITFEQRGFAGAVGADERDDLAGVD